MQLDKGDGCTDFVLSGTVLGLAHWKMDPNNIVLIAEFTEAGTGIVETTISRTVVLHEALKLEYEHYTPKYFKFGLPYHGKVNFFSHIFMLFYILIYIILSNVILIHSLIIINVIY